MNSEPLHPFIKGLVAVLLLLIPILGSLILRSDPVISSIQNQPDSQSIQTVQTFAKFIQTKPELALPPGTPTPTPVLQGTASNLQISRKVEPLTDAQRELISSYSQAWQKPDVIHNEEWRASIEKLLYLAEATGSLDALDLLSQQITIARKDLDDLNKSKADQWLDRYLPLETRENKRKQVVDFFREAVLSGVKETL